MAEAMISSEMAIGKAIPRRRRSREDDEDDEELVEMCSRKKRRTLMTAAKPREACLGLGIMASQVPKKTSCVPVAPKLPPNEVMQRIRDRVQQAKSQLGKTVILPEPPKNQHQKKKKKEEEEKKKKTAVRKSPPQTDLMKKSLASLLAMRRQRK